MTRLTISIGTIDPARLSPRVEGIEATPTFKHKVFKDKEKKEAGLPRKTAEELKEFAEVRAKVAEVSARRRKRESQALLEEIERQRQINSGNTTSQKAELRRKRRNRRLYLNHTKHRNPIDHPHCGDCKLAIENITQKDIYYKEAWRLTEENFRRFYSTINPRGLSRSNEWHLDHTFSIAEGYRQNISASLIASPANLRMLDSASNILKKDRCDITLEELEEAAKAYSSS